jgi:hypothetical protein
LEYFKINVVIHSAVHIVHDYKDRSVLMSYYAALVQLIHITARGLQGKKSMKIQKHFVRGKTKFVN